MLDPQRHPTTRPPARPVRAGGFTLLEVMVVVFIIAILAGILLPSIVHALRGGRKARAQADLHTIEVCLEAYKADFGDYPRFPAIGTYQATTGAWDGRPDRGAILLCRALLGPADAYIDGADSYGTRVRVGQDANGNPVYQGRVYSYLPNDKFKISKPLSTPLGNPPSNTIPSSVTTPVVVDASAKLLDANGNPILYYPANLAPVQVNGAGGFLTKADPTASLSGTPPPRQTSKYNIYDNDNVPADGSTAERYLLSINSSAPLGLSAKSLAYIMGDRATTESPTDSGANCLGSNGNDNNGQIDAGEIPTYSGPYLLWMADQEGNYGLTRRSPTSNVVTTEAATNFDVPGTLSR